MLHVSRAYWDSKQKFTSGPSTPPFITIMLKIIWCQNSSECCQAQKCVMTPIRKKGGWSWCHMFIQRVWYYISKVFIVFWGVVAMQLILTFIEYIFCNLSTVDGRISFTIWTYTVGWQCLMLIRGQLWLKMTNVNVLRRFQFGLSAWHQS